MEKRVHKQIHKKIKKHIPHTVHKAKKIIGFQYPKLLILIVSIILAYYIFSQSSVMDWVGGLNNLSYLGIFIAGMLLAFGFSAPFSVGFFIAAQPQNILLATLIGGFGAMMGDMIIFKTIKLSFMDEFHKLEKTKTIKFIEEKIKNNKNILIKHYLMYIFAGIMIATPLPDEIGVSMIAGLTTIKPLFLSIVSFILHALAIGLILGLSVGI